MFEFEKINLYLPCEVVEQIERDALLFEILKKDRLTVNWNRFINMLIVGYYDQYAEELKDREERIASLLKGAGIDSKKHDYLANEILRSVFDNCSKYENKEKRLHLSLKPTKESELTVQDLISDSENVSGTIFEMILTYLQKPLYKREQIIFNKNYLFLLKACRKNETISVMTTEGHHYKVIPYRIVESKEEMFNYLLCSKITDDENQEPLSLRLNRISDCKSISKKTPFHNEVVRLLEKSVKYPAFVLKTEEQICVRLSTKGMDNYRRIYTNRPQYDSKEECENGFNLYFSCSAAQISIYFRRFGKDAEIISPLSLRDNMIIYFQESINTYTRTIK